MARKKAKALPPKMITVYAEILQETEKAILVRCDEEADGVWLPKSQIKYDGERGDTGVAIEIPELLADEKGFFDGMGRPGVETSPAPAESEQPETVTFYGSFNEEDQDDNGVVFTVMYDDADIDYTIPRDQIVSLHYDMPETESASITVSRAYAIEAGMMEAPEVNQPESAPEFSAGKRVLGDNVKWIKEERITVSQPLTESEKARYAEEMAALDKEIEELEDERSDVSSRLKKQIDAKEQERREMSAHVNDGELRTISCDCLKDYNTGEMVWTEAFPPYHEVQRRKMTKEEMNPSLLEFSERPSASVPFDAVDDAEAAKSETPADAAAAGMITLCGRLAAVFEDEIRVVFADLQGEDVEISIPFEDVTFDNDMQPGDSGPFSFPESLAVAEGVIEALPLYDVPQNQVPEAAAERSCGTCSHIHQQPNEGEDDPCFDCGQNPDLPNWSDGLVMDQDQPAAESVQ